MLAILAVSFVVLAAVATDLNGLISDLIASAQGGDLMPFIAAAIGLTVFGLRWGLSKKVKWFKTYLGGLVLVFGTSLLASIGASLREGNAGFWTILLVALSAAWTATGIHTHAKDAMASLAEHKAKKDAA